jgi:hypothetical protein
LGASILGAGGATGALNAGGAGVGGTAGMGSGGAAMGATAAGAGGAAGGAARGGAAPLTAAFTALPEIMRVNSPGPELAGGGAGIGVDGMTGSGGASRWTCDSR